MDITLRELVPPVAEPWPVAEVAAERLASRAAFEDLAGEWRDLEGRAGGAVLFQSFDWCRLVLDHWQAEARDCEPRILIARRRGRLAGVLPLRIVRRGRLRLATGLGEPFQQYSDVLVDRDGSPDVVAALVAAAAQLDADGLEFLKVREDSALLPSLRGLGATRSNEDAAPLVDIARHGDFETYYATLNAKTRKNMRNARNRLARSGELAHRVAAPGAETRGLVRRAFEGRERWLAEQGLTSRAFRDDTFAAFVERAAASGLETLAMSLEFDGAPMADQWGFVHRGRYYAYAATWDPAFEESSPGKLHLGEVIDTCAARGIGIADFLMPASRYKLTWATDIVPLADYSVPLTLWGRIHASLWSVRLRPALKRTARFVPATVRSRVTRLLLRRA